MDGTLDRTNQQWKSANGYAAPLSRDAAEQLLCPLCARDGHDERLREIGGVPVHGCSRGHRYRSEPQPG
jgi:hypothetical protein